jgi:hypothetical protein
MTSVIRFVASHAQLLLLAGLATVTSCTLSETRPDSVTSREPELRMRVLEAASLNGLDVLPLHEPADLSLTQRNQLIAGYVTKQLPLHVRTQINAYNPSPTPATLTGFAYTVLVDGRPLGTGRQVAAISLPAGDSVRVPLEFEFNTYKFLGEDAMPALRNFALGFGEVRRQRVTLQVRPLLRVPKGRFSGPAARTALALSKTSQQH